MKKLYWLNAMVNFFWIISMITIPIAFIAMIGVFFFDTDVEGLNIRMNGNDVKLVDFSSKVYFSINALSYLALVYIVYLFKQLISIFLKAQIFSEKVISIFHQIGFVLLGNGLLLMITTFVYTLYVEKSMELEFGISQNAIMIFMGIFFMVLSEIFRISKNIQLENDLTI